MEKEMVRILTEIEDAKDEFELLRFRKRNKLLFLLLGAAFFITGALLGMGSI